MHNLTRNSKIADIADAYGVDGRTIFRWIAAGVPVHKPKAVAEYLLKQKTPSQQALAACQRLISNHENSNN